jgi:hypothetical protein
VDASLPETENAKRAFVAARATIEEMVHERERARAKSREATEIAAAIRDRDARRIERLETEVSELRLRVSEADRNGAAAVAMETDERVEMLSREVAEVTVSRDVEAEKARAAQAEVRRLESDSRARAEAAGSDVRRALASENQKLALELAAEKEKVSELEQKVASLSALLEEARGAFERARAENEELETLREMRSDFARQERRTAEIIRRQKETVETLETKYREESALRKQYFNVIEDMKGKIRVYARARPLSEKEIKEKQRFSLAFPDAFTVEHPWRDERAPRSYAFDRSFDAGSTQESVFEDAQYLVQSAFDGYNVCIFAYGQTGSGKTHTVYGDSQNPGLTPRAMGEVIRIANEGAKRGKISAKIEAYMLELYREQIYDLLRSPGEKSRNDSNAAPPKLDIKKDSKGWVTVTNATVVPVRTKDEIMKVIETGLKVRKTASTEMNAASSRSHLIFSLVIETTDLQTQVVTRGKLSFVDLAGSERVKKSGAVGSSMKEAQAINKSLSALGDVISALAEEKQHVPYRNHKLTMLMSDSLGGNAKTLMFVNVSPSDGNLEETQNSLTYAARVRAIKNTASKDVADKETLRLRSALSAWRKRAGEVEAETQEIEDRVQIEMAGDGLPVRDTAIPRGDSGGAGRLPNQ